MFTIKEAIIIYCSQMKLINMIIADALEYVL